MVPLLQTVLLLHLAYISVGQSGELDRQQWRAMCDIDGRDPAAYSCAAWAAGDPVVLGPVSVRYLGSAPQLHAPVAAAVDAIAWAFDGWWDHAREHDELLPLARDGDSSFCNAGATLVDSLSTLWLAGLDSRFERARDAVAARDYSRLQGCNLFETNIRILGGLLSAGALSGDKMFFQKAAVIAGAMLPSFNTPSGIPCNYFPEQPTCKTALLAEAGTLTLEFTYLSQVTGNAAYQAAAERAMAEIVRQKVALDGRCMPGIYPSLLSVVPGATDAESEGASCWGTMGTGADSFYEYLLKLWLLTGRHESFHAYKRLWDMSMNNTVQHLLRCSEGGYLYVGSSNGTSASTISEHLACFLGGNLALGDPKYLKVAAAVTRSCVAMHTGTATQLGVDKVSWRGSFPASDCIDSGAPLVGPAGGRPDAIPTAPRSIQRPETFESLFFMYQSTGDPSYRQAAWDIFVGLNKTRVASGGFASAVDATSCGAGLLDKQHSWFIAETLKYLLLILQDTHRVNLTEWVFTTEAHPLPVFQPRFPSTLGDVCSENVCSPGAKRVRECKDIPVVVLSANNPTFVATMVKQIEQHGYPIFVLDDASDFPPTLRLLDELSRRGSVVVYRNTRRLGEHSFLSHEAGLIQRLPRYFAVTDADLLLNEDIPQDFLCDMRAVLDETGAVKVGFALDISDAESMLAGTFKDGLTIERLEGAHWTRPLPVQGFSEPVYDAPVDTTFALYDKTKLLPEGGSEPSAFIAPGLRFAWENHRRIAGRFTAKHRQWYPQELCALPLAERRAIWAGERSVHSKIAQMIQKTDLLQRDRSRLCFAAPVNTSMPCQGRQNQILWDYVFSKSQAVDEGFFIEFGAQDGIAYSNSYFFEKQLGWRGLLFEPIPHEHGSIARTRPRAAVINGGVCQVDGSMEFGVAPILGWSGRMDTYDEQRASSLKLQGIDAACFSLATVLELFEISHVNYLSVDTEGSELEALKGFPWSNVSVDVVGVEILTGTPARAIKEAAIRQFLGDNGFEPLIDDVLDESTKDSFFVPARKQLRNVNSYAAFDKMKLVCQKLQRCLR